MKDAGQGKPHMS